MEKVRDLIKGYIRETIYTKRNMRRRIYQLEQENKELKLDLQDVIKQKDKYKENNKNLRRKIKENK